MAKGKRNFEEGAEGLETVKNDAPESKFQKDQQVAESTGFKVETGKSDFKLDKRKAPGSTLKQEIAASVVKDASYGGSLSGDGANFNGAKSSGSVGGILGASNATPVAGKSRADGRTSKKLDRNSTKLNFIPNEQVLVEWDESKPLADSADQDQGFNGTYRNEFARSQKDSEAVPGALMFDRSVDLLVKDNLYFGQGQKVHQSGSVTDEDLTCTMRPNAQGILKYTSDGEYSGGKTGNYLLKDVQILLSNSGAPVYTLYDDEDLSQSASESIANKSSAQDHILNNDAELVRESMDSKAGDEKADIWTPLARAVKSPTQLVGFLRDMEATVGNEVLTAYRKFSTSMSFQLNRAHKDGQDTKGPAILANRGLGYNFVSKAATEATLGSEIGTALFNRSAYLSGAASTMIPLYDSIAKYSTKADFLVQPRSYRMHLQTADNNMDPLKCSRLFNQAYASQEVFSTIDRDYDPMSPICLSDKAAVISRLSHHKTGSYIQSSVKYTVKAKGTGDTETICLIPKKIEAELANKGLNAVLLYPHEAAGDIDNISAYGVVTADAGYEFANGEEFKILIGDIGDFSSSKAYKVGDMCVYNKYLYMCTAAHAAGAWDGDDFTKQEYSDSVDCGALTLACSSVAPTGFYWQGSGNDTFNVKDCFINEGSEKLYAYQGGPAIYAYDDLRNNYTIVVRNPLTEGFEKYLVESIGAKYHNLITDKGNIGVVTIPAVHSTMYFSLWSILLCAATPYIVKERINSMRDVLYYEKNVEYPFGSTLISIGDCLSKGYSNFNYSNYDTELGSKVMLPSTALTWILPETYQQVGYADSKSQVLMPWYTNQAEVRNVGGSYTYLDDASAMSFPSIRSGVKLASLDTLYGMSEKDVRLCLDKVSSFAGLSPTLGSSHTYKYSSVGDGQLILSISPATMTAKNIMSLPRELGFFMTAPYGVLTPNYSGYINYDQSVLGSSSFRCYYWYGGTPATTDDQGNDAILKSIAININRAANFKQSWYCVLASGTVPPIDHGFLLSANQAYNGSTGALLNGRSEFKPYATLADEVNGPYTTNMNYLRSIQKFLWTRIQKLPFILSPFDGYSIDNTGSPNDVVLCDPYDLLYVFGLGGFRASDFRESVYNREKEVVNQGLLFVSDPWIEDSPVFKDGSLSSGISTSKGFSL
jgi:hypothetical protein